MSELDTNDNFKFQFTIFSRLSANTGDSASITLAEFKKVVDNHDVRGSTTDGLNIDALSASKDGEAIVLARMTNGRRGKRFVECVTGMGIDIDGISDAELPSVFNALGEFEYYAWTTHSSGAECKGGETRVRIVVPVREPHLPEHHKGFYARLDQLIGCCADPACSDVARMHLLPSTFNPANAKFWHNTGRLLSPEDDLPPLPLNKKQTHRTQKTPSRRSKRVSSEKHFRKALAKYNADHSRDYPSTPDTCPMCNHNGCFVQLADEPDKWACFSSQHEDGGFRGDGCFFGSAADIDAHLNDTSVRKHLKKHGYFRPQVLWRFQPVDATSALLNSS